MSTATDVSPQAGVAVERTSREIVFGEISEMVGNHAPVPESTHVYAFGLVCLSFLDNDRPSVDVWAADLGLSAPAMHPAVPVMTYRATGYHEAWAGWTVEVSCTVSDRDAERAALPISWPQGWKQPAPRLESSPADSGARGLSLTHCNHMSGYRQALDEADSALLCKAHPTRAELIAGGRS